MVNTRLLLREELILNDRKRLLSEESIISINNPNHVKHVLGINVSLNESNPISIRRQIIEEQLMLESMLSSINNFIGSALEKGKEKAIDIVDSVKNLKDIALLIKDLILSPEFMGAAVESMKKVANNILNQLKIKVDKIINTIKVTLYGFSEKFKAFIDKVVSLLTKLTDGTGWKGFLSMLGFCALVRFLEDSVIGKLIDGGVEFATKQVNLISGITTMFDSFKSFITNIGGEDIKPILSWFGDIGAGSIIGGLFSGISIINIIAELLAPVIKSINWNKKLVKR